ncbi:unnamed protein product [Sordaria macrospora k-hell]|uniref:WGS project CABT00000000 data, contig 2.57 n=1 Tax=Sordaria macrospora (strain ATCC MYA-333 / DSM 997 / K(L3346) / K-hell) TaxID=771870 RepID=F7WA16_SORMK|nr:uncharacterized protein SMAC_08395 [Sordaria macrospora k-hell]CCC14084.1 unnamed protein product [Sordaria macrospora k-hell]
MGASSKSPTSPKSPSSPGSQSPKSEQPPPRRHQLPLTPGQHRSAPRNKRCWYSPCIVLDSLAEDPADDGASTISSLASTTASLSSSIYDYRTIHGRTYHAEIGNAESWEPNDQRHVDALEIFHHSMVQLDGKLYLSPLDKKKIHKVLDVGTGNGMWAMQVLSLSVYQVRAG